MDIKEKLLSSYCWFMNSNNVFNNYQLLWTLSSIYLLLINRLMCTARKNIFPIGNVNNIDFIFIKFYSITENNSFLSP